MNELWLTPRMRFTCLSAICDARKRKPEPGLNHSHGRIKRDNGKTYCGMCDMAKGGAALGLAAAGVNRDLKNN